MITKDEALNTIAAKYGHADWTTARYRVNEQALHEMLHEAMDYYYEQSNLHKPDVVRSLPFVTWLFSNYQMFHDRWIKLTGNGHYENPYTTGQPALTWDEVIKEYELRQ